MGLVIPHRLTAGLGENEEADIEMEMGRFAGSGRDLVDIQIDGGLVHGKTRQASFFAGLPQSDGAEVTDAVGMPTGLQPPIELHVMHDQRGRTGRIHHRRRPGEVARKARAKQSIGVLRTKVQHLLPVDLLARPDYVGLTDLADGGLERRLARQRFGGGRHPAKLLGRSVVAAEIERSFRREPHRIEVGLRNHRGGQAVPKFCAFYRRKILAATSEQAGKGREPYQLAIDHGRTTVVIRDGRLGHT